MRLPKLFSGTRFAVGRSHPVYSRILILNACASKTTEVFCWKNNFSSWARGWGSLPCLFINIWKWVFYLLCVFSKETIRSLEPKVFSAHHYPVYWRRACSIFLHPFSFSFVSQRHSSASIGDKSRRWESTKSLFWAWLRLSSPLAGCGCLRSGRYPRTHKGVCGSFGEGTGRLLFLIMSDKLSTNLLFLQAQLLAIFW